MGGAHATSFCRGFLKSGEQKPWDPMTVSIRRICAFIDGTGNQAVPMPSDGRTNVRQLFEHLSPQPDTAALYLPGVGCAAQHELDDRTTHNTGLHQTLQGILNDTYPHVSGVLGKAMGLGLTARILAAYAFICAMKREHPGAQVVIVGFSRGAYACCALAHFMEQVGMTLSDRLGLHRPSPQALWTYSADEVRNLLREGVLTEWKPPASGVEAIQVDFLGCWDTVCALVSPASGMNWPWIDADTHIGEGLRNVLNALGGRMHQLGRMVRSRHLIESFLPPNVVKARHALALHEYRRAFEPMVWDVPADPSPRNIQQMWFPGAHSDVGGGYREDLASHRVSDLALHWMMSEMGLPTPPSTASSKPTWAVHDSGNAKGFTASKPVLRHALTRTDRPAHLRTMQLAPALQQAAEHGARLTSAEPGRMPAPQGMAFRASVASLHPKALHLVTRVWIESCLVRATQTAGMTHVPTQFWPLRSDIEQFQRTRWPALVPATLEQWLSVGRSAPIRQAFQRWLAHAVVTRSGDEQTERMLTLASTTAEVIRQSAPSSDAASIHGIYKDTVTPIWPLLEQAAVGHAALVHVLLGQIRFDTLKKTPVVKI